MTIDYIFLFPMNIAGTNSQIIYHENIDNVINRQNYLQIFGKRIY